MALQRLGDQGIIDRRWAVRPDADGGRVLIPLTQRPTPDAELPGDLIEAEAYPHPRLPPADRMRLELAGTLDDELLDELPDGWQVLGDVCLVRLPEALEARGEAVGRALGQALDVASVLDLEESHGELREPETRLLWGTPDTRTEHREHGLVFHLDPAKVMFSKGNKAERHRLVDRVEPGEQVVDLFAGIGYFTLPLARAGAEVIACEKNPVSAGFLAENVVANDLEGQVEIREGDCREVAPEGVADRVLLGYFPGTEAFLATAVQALAEPGGLLHYHTTAWADDGPEGAWQELEDHEALAGVKAGLLGGHRVKGYAPGVEHVVLDIEVSL